MKDKGHLHLELVLAISKEQHSMLHHRKHALLAHRLGWESAFISVKDKSKEETFCRVVSLTHTHTHTYRQTLTQVELVNSTQLYV